MGEKGRLQTSQLQKAVGSMECVVDASEPCSTKIHDHNSEPSTIQHHPVMKVHEYSLVQIYILDI